MTDMSLDDVRRLYVAHAPALRLTLQRLAGAGLDPDDLVQEVFVVALRKHTELARVSSPVAWLFGVATKVAATRRRTASWRRWLGIEEAQELSSAESPARTLEQKQASELVQRALGSLSSAKRDVFVLFELQQLSGEEIAQALEIPLKTVWSRLFYARRDFATAVEKLGGAP
ncbi:MAG: RNA polymerase sigma factor [Myxococcales bacterium]|nr:RNA polymerase sigma factor [Myxococcales bacterium]